jgi:hypothetical protein
LIKTTHQHLLLLVGFNTLIYRKYYDTPPILVGHQYTDAVKNVKHKNFPPEKKQRATVLQLSVASKTLVFQICHADAGPELLREFLNNYKIMFWGTAIKHDV